MDALIHIKSNHIHDFLTSYIAKRKIFIIIQKMVIVHSQYNRASKAKEEWEKR